MKDLRFFFLLVCWLPGWLLNAQMMADCGPEKQIGGRISGGNTQAYTVLLEKVDGGVVDSATTRDGRFVFCLPSDLIPYYVLKIRGESRFNHYLLTDFSGPTTIDITLPRGDVETVEESPRSERWTRDRDQARKYLSQFLRDRRRMEEGPDWAAVRQTIDQAFYQLFTAALERDPVQGVALMRAEITRWESIDPSWTSATGLRDQLRNLPADLQSQPVVQGLEKTISQYIYARPGARALDFTIAGLYGNLLSTEEYRDRYLLLDFWGSWCKPCIEKNETLRQEYEALREAGLVILTVMMDYARQPYEETLLDAALENDPAYPWPQGVLFRDERSDEILDYYRAYILPRTVLIGPGGEVIAVDPGSTTNELLTFMREERH